MGRIVSSRIDSNGAALPAPRHAVPSRAEGLEVGSCLRVENSTEGCEGYLREARLNVARTLIKRVSVVDEELIQARELKRDRTRTVKYTRWYICAHACS